MITKLYKFFIQMLNNTKLKNKLMLSYFILIIIPLGLLTFASYRQVSKFVEGQVLYSAKQVFEQTNAFLVYKLGKIIDISDFIALDTNLNTVVNRDPNSYTLSEQLKDGDELTGFLKSYQKAEDVYHIKLYVNDGLIFSKENVNLFSMKDIQNSKWLKRLQSYHGKAMFCPAVEMREDNSNQENTISIVKKIISFDSYSKIAGILRIDILESDIQSIIKKANTTQNGLTYLLNSDGLVVATSDYKLTDKWKFDTQFCNTLSNQKDNWSEIKINNEKLIVGCKSVEGTDWFIVSVIPYDNILSSSSSIRNQMVVIMLLLATVAYILAYFISSSSTKRINQLILKMKKVQNGNLDASIASSNKDEIGELVDNFNYMVKKIEVLIEDRYKLGLEVKSAELKALQAQINPHFLYNTLDLINWTAIKNKVPEISAIVKSLAKFYKLSLNKGKDIVTIRDEIEHVSLYIDIQNRRFENKILYHLDVNEEVYQYRILKIILQPIVENAILHGIMEKNCKSGTISISGRLLDNTIIFRVTDDGVGMSKEKLTTIFEDSNDQSFHGYGVKNINNRIKLYYGEQYGLNFASVLGEGTTVEVSIPAVR